MPCALLIEWPRRCDSGYDIRRAAARQFRDAGKAVDCTGQRCECFRGFPVQAAAAMCVAFELDTQRRTFGAGAGQPQPRARVLAADDAPGLVAGDAAVGLVAVAEIVATAAGPAAKFLARPH